MLRTRRNVCFTVDKISLLSGLSTVPSYLVTQSEVEEKVEEVQPALEDQIEVVLLSFVNRLDLHQRYGLF